MLKTLIDPVDGVPRAVEGRHWVLPMIALCLAVSFSGLAFAWRLDASAQVLSKLEMSGELTKSSEREIGEEIDQAHRVALVGGAAKGIFLMPLALLFTALALKVAAWLLGKKLLFSQAFTIAAVAFLPIAVFHLLFGLVALKQAVVTVAMAKELVPSSLSFLAPPGAMKVARGLSQLDFFNLWSAMLLGLGLAAGTRLSRPRGLGLGLLLYAMLSAVQVGLPGLVGQGGPS
ncbi:MAG: YIP1 family protein [Archangiaceae bacterium]|nr:YIP1 family protein [Archangiaceae bacterium]